MTEIVDPLAELWSDMRAPNWPHNAPARPFTSAEAHAVMQSHIECDLECRRKRAAWQALVDLGEIVPDYGRTR